ncbi:hypothetical protein [Pseudomonas brassicacearum]|uniref:Uncharacterized protein n=1 Tax=Pseudomonas brassicacearum subsp. neoaurantiaca TaxID=494916 RepID=A0A7V8RMD8_9PSED|nr:hypothetical protein [Pseudomonas brassicacearum]MBA1379166.1 hypothetical protein [Pseudomonas brassicacearum subsp. neoaurantiaca]
MTTDNGNTETFDGDSASSDDAGGGVSIEPVQDARAVETVIVASFGDYWANLKVEYWWAPDGRTFTVNTKQYRARGNGGNSGDVELRIMSGDNNTGWQRLTDRATQNGEWHNLTGQLTVQGNIAATATIGFHYIYDRSMADDPHLYGSEIVNYTVPQPTITSPGNGDGVSPRFTIRGTGVTGAEVVVFRRNSSSQIAPPAQVQNGQWNTTVSPAIALGNFNFSSRQRINGQNSEWAHVQVTVVLDPPVITGPINNSTGTELRPNFSGTGDNGAQVQIFRNGDTPMSNAVNVANNRTWSATLNQNLNWGPNTLTARQKMGNVFSANSSVTVTLLPHPPSITSPTADTQDRQFTVSGTNGVNGATVRIYLESNNSLVGTGQPNTTANWNVTVTVPPGPVSLVATQTINGAVSGLSGAQGFRIRPPKLTEPTVTYPVPERAVFSGTGYPGATVDIVIERGPTGAVAPDSVTVRDAGTWETERTAFPPGSYELKLIQKVRSGANSWIESEPLTYLVDRQPPASAGVTDTTTVN